MKKTTGIVFLAALLIASSILASSRVTNVELRHRDGAMVACIDIDGPVRFTHQSVEAKEGKPFRLLVDVLAATHELGAKDFMNLPSCPVRSIRSSQYSVNPEQVVRLVLDMEDEAVYRVESDKNSVSIIIPDKAGKAFPMWSSAVVVANARAHKPSNALAQKPAKKAAKASSHKSTADLNKALAADRASSLEGKPVAKKTKTKAKPTLAKAPVVPYQGGPWRAGYKPPKVAAKATVAAAKPKTVAPKAVVAKAPKAKKVEQPKSQMAVASAKSAAKPKDVVKKTSPAKSQRKPIVSALSQKDEQPTSTVETPVPETDRSVHAPDVRPTTVRSRQFSDKDVWFAPKAAPTAKPAAQPQLAATPAQPTPKQAPAPKPAPAKQPAKTEVAKATDDKADDKSTSRFRRQPVISKKIKGTLVAEFPKRLVVKYKSAGRRDPFETLINEARVYTDPVAQRIPNVEGLRLVGVIEAPAGNRALLEGTDGYGYILKAGDRVRKGYVLRIDSKNAYFQIFEYGWSRTVALSIEN